MGLTVYGGGGKPEEEKTVTAGTSAIEVNPSSGKVMKKVTVNPTPTESKSVTPTTSELTVTPSEGKHLSQVVVGAVEDVTPEVTAQTPVITQIAENLGVTITTPGGTNKQILQGNNANLLNIKDNAKKEGAYAWKKKTAADGDFLGFVTSDDANAYPDGGEQGGYWYERASGGGCTVQRGSVTLSSDNNTITIPNPLGSADKVKYISLLFKNKKNMSNNKIYAAFYDAVNSIDNRISYSSSYIYNGTGNFIVEISDDTINLRYKYSDYKFYANTYEWAVIGDE